MFNLGKVVNLALIINAWILNVQPCPPDQHSWADCCFSSIDYWQQAARYSDCIYGYLAYRDALKHNATEITLFHPPDKLETQVEIQYAAVRSIAIDESSELFKISGAYKLVWHDDRLSWTKEISNRTSLGLKNPQKLIWLPEFDKLDSEYDYDDATANSNGLVSARYGFNVSNVCAFDYTKFPYDGHECCTSIQAPKGWIKHTLAPGFHIWNMDRMLSRVWEITAITFTNRTTIGNEGIPLITYTLCVSVKRSSATAVNEFVLPLIIAIVMVMVVPFFGSWEFQALSKVGCLCLQFACLFVVVLDTDQLQFGATTPTLLLIYEFVIWTTAFNLLVTAFCWSLSKRMQGRKESPPANLTSICDLINRYGWCTGPETETKAIDRLLSTNTADSVLAQAIRNEEWADLWRAVNTCVGLVFLVIYIGGIMIIKS